MFSTEFFPTPDNVITDMLRGYELEGKSVLEPSAGKGDIVDYCIGSGAFVIACEKHPDLRKILNTKCNVIADDFFTVKSEQVSHIHMIVMNPPFSNGEKHILHAYEIAPPGCDIVALCNYSNIKNPYSQSRQQLVTIIEQNGGYENLGNCFSSAERETDVEVALVRIKKPGENIDAEFEGFFLEDVEESQANGIMPYNLIRDLVNRYVAAVKLYDEQLAVGVRMNSLLSDFYGENLAFTMTEQGAPVSRNSFKKALQKAGWQFVFNKLNMQKYSTKGLKEDINKFVEQQHHIPFTMRNIYKMIEIVIATHSQRMDKALLEVFDKLTEYYHDNRYNVEGWKTNSHYLINQTFILPYLIYQSWGSMSIQDRNAELIDDFVKALCYINGKNYDHCLSFRERCTTRYLFLKNDRYLSEKDVLQYSEGYRSRIPYRKDTEEKALAFKAEQEAQGQKIEILPPLEWGKWAKWEFFDFKCYKKGTCHFRFRDPDLWGKMNQHISRIKGYPLFEFKQKGKKEERKFKKQQAAFA